MRCDYRLTGFDPANDSGALVRDGIHLDEAIETTRREGLLRLAIDRAIFDIEDVPPIDPNGAYEFATVVDRIIVRDNSRERLLKAIDSASEIGDGNVVVCYVTPEQMENDPAIKSDPARWEELRFSTRYACANCGSTFAEVSSRLFSFNGPQGACLDCDGLGLQLRFDIERTIDLDRSLANGAIRPWNESSATRRRSRLKELAPILENLGIHSDQNLKELSPKSLQALLTSTDKESPGVFALLHREMATTDDDARHEELASLERELPCQSCGGSRLNRYANSVRFQEKNLTEILTLPVSKIKDWFDSIDFKLQTEAGQLASATIINEIRKRLAYLTDVGVDYLSLSRSADSLSGGELQRVPHGSIDRFRADQRVLHS